MKSILWGAPFFLLFFLVMKYQDTEAFQGTIKFLLTPDANMAAPIFWQEYRMLLLGGMMLLLLLYYSPALLTIHTLIAAYRHSPACGQRPSLTAQQASFLFLRDRTGNLVIWLLELCQLGAITLDFKKTASIPGRLTGDLPR